MPVLIPYIGKYQNRAGNQQKSTLQTSILILAEQDAADNAKD
jgi:hypothetical protein